MSFIFTIGKAEPIVFAAQELARILEKTGSPRPSIIEKSRYEPEHEGLWLGRYDEFSSIRPLSEEYGLFDDELYISTSGAQGIIAGVNNRSVLLAVYRYVKALGCRFVSFGPQGEYLPKITLSDTSVVLQERPSYRHRGVCIEGAVTEENIIDMVDILPKLGMNSYYIQFREAYTFFDRAYRNLGNPLLETDSPLPVEQARASMRKIVLEMQKRGLLYHGVGHGWTCEPFGVPGLAWEEWAGELDEETLQNFALINGKRGLWEGIPLNTNACYSNPEVRRKMVDDIIDYMQQHPEVDLLHVWLADGTNNQCECGECTKHLPSALYVQLLNELDMRMSACGIDSKIVFLIYVDLLWSPKDFALKDPDRFLIMFAPITRSYRSSFRVPDKLPSIPEYSRNKNIMPQDVALNIAFLKAWQEIFPGSGFDYDYHFMWAHLRDPGQLRISQILSEDIRHLMDLRLDGFISCQVSRAAFPNMLGITVLGEMLWNRDTDYTELCEDYFKAAYGTGWELALAHLRHISELFYGINYEESISAALPERVELCKRIRDAFDEFYKAPELSTPHSTDSQRIMWHYLKLHTEIWREYTDAFALLCAGDTSAAKERWEQARRFAFSLEPEIQAVFDLWNYNNVAGGSFIAPAPSPAN